MLKPWLVGPENPAEGSRRGFATFAEAEKFARKRFGRGNGNTSGIYHAAEPGGRWGLRHVVLAGWIAEDALGRVWTDLTPYGASHA